MTPLLPCALLLLAPPDPREPPPTDPGTQTAPSPHRSGADESPAPDPVRGSAPVPEPDPAFSAARFELTRGRWAAARERLVALRDATPDDALVRNELGVALFQEGAYRAAVSELERAVALDPSRANAWANLGEARRRAGDAEGGALAFGRALALRPDDDAAQEGRARCLAELGRMQEAQEQLAEHPEGAALQRELERAGSPSQFALIEKARAAVMAGDTPRAGLLVDRLLRATPNSADGLALRALIGALTGHSGAARADVAAALALDPRCHLAQEVLFVLEDTLGSP